MELQFGTGGIRGIMGSGPDDFNEHTIWGATHGLGLWLLSIDAQKARGQGVAIAYDTRDRSDEFARLAAAVLEEMGIPAYCFPRPTPTPVLSFTVRRMGCAAGIVITASHNTKEYNGYKVYNAEGCQLVPHEANALTGFISPGAPPPDWERFAPRLIPPDIREKYLGALQGLALPEDEEAKKALKIVYTPLHGSGEGYVQDALRRDGFTAVYSVVAQQLQNGAFPTAPSPNPEDPRALSMAIEMAEGLSADLVIGTDPDCDRIGAAARHNGEWRLITGNQMGALLTQYILERKQPLPANGVVIKTIVTNDLGAKLAQEAGLAVHETLTGFKYIGEMMTRFERGGAHSFVFGYEESYGYLIGNHARDKDAIVSAQLICEMAAFRKQQGKTLIKVLEELYQEHGFHLDALDTEPTSSPARGRRIMERFRMSGGSLMPSASVEDYLAGIRGLPPEDVLKYTFADGSWVALRVSGTEPKLKVYYSIKDKSRERAQSRLTALRGQIKEAIAAEP